MYIIIGTDGKQYGPVPLPQLRQWIADGRVNAQTQVQAEGSSEWKELSAYPELAGPSGLAVPPPGTATLDIGACIRRSWTLLKNHFGLIVGVTFLMMFLLFFVGIVLRVGVTVASGIGWRELAQSRGFEAIRRQMPGILISNLWFCLMTGPIVGGLYSFYLQLIRGQPTSMSDAFAGFGPQFGQLVLGGFVTSVLIMLGFLLCIIPGVYLSVAWKFTLPSIIDKRLGFWESMQLSRKTVTGRWWLVLALVLLSGLIGGAGFLMCCVGILVTFPIAIGSIAYAYEDLIGSQLPAAA